MNGAMAVRQSKAENDADTITRDSREFLLAHSRGEKPSVPDSAWHGTDCWIIETGHGGWRISERGRETMAVLSARECAPISMKSAKGGRATRRAGSA